MTVIIAFPSCTQNLKFRQFTSLFGSYSCLWGILYIIGMCCKFIFHLPSAGSMPLIITLTFFAIPHMADHFTFFLFFTIPSVPLPQFTDSRGSALKAAVLSLIISSWLFLPFHSTCVYYITVLHLTWVYKTVQNYTTFPVLFSGDCRHRVWFNPAKLFTGCCKRADTGHPSGSLEAYKNVLLDFDMVFSLRWKKRKNASSTLQKQRSLYIFESTTYQYFSPLPFPLLFIFFLFLLQLHVHQCLA